MPTPTTRRSARVACWPATATKGCARCSSPAPTASSATAPVAVKTGRGRPRRGGGRRPASRGAAGQLRGARRHPPGAARLPRFRNGGWPQNDAEGSFWTTPVTPPRQPVGGVDGALPAAGRRDLRRARPLRSPGPHPGPPGDHGRRRQHGHPGQGVLHGGAEVGPGHHGRDACEPMAWSSRSPSTKTRASEPRTS